MRATVAAGERSVVVDIIYRLSDSEEHRGSIARTKTANNYPSVTTMLSVKYCLGYSYHKVAAPRPGRQLIPAECSQAAVTHPIIVVEIERKFLTASLLSYCFRLLSIALEWQVDVTVGRPTCNIVFKALQNSHRAAT